MFCVENSILLFTKKIYVFFYFILQCYYSERLVKKIGGPFGPVDLLLSLVDLRIARVPDHSTSELRGPRA